MLRLVKKLLLALVLFISLGFLVEQVFFIKRYSFELEPISIAVSSDLCEFCFTDLPYTHTIALVHTKSGKRAIHSFYAEGPQLEFGFNQNKDTLLVNCPGFAYMLVDVKTVQTTNPIYSIDSVFLKSFRVYCKINKNEKSIQLSKPMLPGTVW